jgi:hypothetical protein
MAAMGQRENVGGQAVIGARNFVSAPVSERIISAVPSSSGPADREAVQVYSSFYMPPVLHCRVRLRQDPRAEWKFLP